MAGSDSKSYRRSPYRYENGYNYKRIPNKYAKSYCKHCGTPITKGELLWAKAMPDAPATSWHILCDKCHTRGYVVSDGPYSVAKVAPVGDETSNGDVLTVAIQRYRVAAPWGA